MIKKNRVETSRRVAAEILEEFHRYPGPKWYESGEPIRIKMRIKSAAGLRPKHILLDKQNDGLISVLVVKPPNAEVIRADYEVVRGRLTGEVWISCFNGLLRA